jgi:hypothetical protein
MAADARKLLLVMVLATAALTAFRPASGQSLPPPETVLPPPRSAEPAPSGPMQLTQNPAPFPPPPAPPPAPLPDSADPLYQPRDPGPDGWGPYGPPSLPPLFFADVEVDILKPHLKAALSNAVFFNDGTETTVRPPTTQVGWTAAPRFEVGHYLPNSLGLFALYYRGFVTDGTQNATALDGTPFALRTRFDLNQAGLDYGSLPYSFAPRWDVAGRIGVAWADVFFDNRAASAAQTLYASNNYNGAGPHARIQLRRHFGLLPGLELFGRGDLFVLVGQIRQRFTEIDVNPDGSTRVGYFAQPKTQTVPVFNLQVGLSYTPPSLSNWTFTAGYQLEEWWFVGQVDLLDSRGQFSTNGIFLRAFVTF